MKLIGFGDKFLTHSAAPSSALKGIVQSAAQAEGKPLHLCWGVEGLTYGLPAHTYLW